MNTHEIPTAVGMSQPLGPGFLALVALFCAAVAGIVLINWTVAAMLADTDPDRPAEAAQAKKLMSLRKRVTWACIIAMIILTAVMAATWVKSRPGDRLGEDLSRKEIVDSMPGAYAADKTAIPGRVRLIDAGGNTCIFDVASAKAGGGEGNEPGKIVMSPTHSCDAGFDFGPLEKAQELGLAKS